MVNTFLALPILLLFWPSERGIFSLRISWPLLALALSPSLAALVLVQYSENPPEAQGMALRDPSIWMHIFWIPIVEEIVFRLGLYRILMRRSSALWAGYGVALSFALLHSAVGKGVDEWSQWTIPLGPFLLSVCAQYLFESTGKICYSIIFHGAANASAIIFHLYGPVWLERLSYLYLN